MVRAPVTVVSTTVPVRTCIGCRRRAPRTDLVRVVTGPGGTAVPDLRGRMPGRGASLHPTPECLELADRRRAFARALRVTGPVDTGAVRRHVEAVAGGGYEDEDRAPTHSSTELRSAPPGAGPDRKRVEKR